MSYLNVEEVEFALRQLSNQYPQYCRLISLPNRTHENRKCHALTLFDYSHIFPFNFFNWFPEWLYNWFDSLFGSPKKHVVIVGGHHAGEWVPPDALVFLCQRAIHCLHYGSDIVLGDFTLRKNTLVNILKKVEIVIFPQVNPDGRKKSMTTPEVFWRKNLRPSADPLTVGVDLNRNYDFLWNFPAHFSSTASVASSTDASAHTYIGPASLSEPETKNVRWLAQEKNVDYFIDVHSFSQLVLYNWADDQSQNQDANMNFMNPGYNSERGIKEDNAYREYIPEADSNINRALAMQMAGAISSVRNNQYTVQEWVELYPASGTSTDYLQSLYFRSSRSKKIHSFCIECGKQFQPVREERAWVIKEVTAALLQFCRTVASQ